MDPSKGYLEETELSGKINHCLFLVVYCFDVRALILGCQSYDIASDLYISSGLHSFFSSLESGMWV